MKILVTGSSGFVGQQFLKKFYEDERNQVCRIDIVGDADYGNTDARDFFRKDRTKFDLVVHLAAVVGGRLTIEGDPLSVAVDLSIDAEMFQWALRTKPGRVVYFSSSAAYPTRLQKSHSWNKLHEDDIDLDRVESADMTYGWAKLTGEYLAKFAEEAGVRTHVFRPFSGYGETQSRDYPFPSFIERAVRREDPFDIWGTGEQSRDFIHIDDIVNATLAAVDQDVPGPVNLCWGRRTTFNELAQLVTFAEGYFPKFEHHDDMPSGVQNRVGDSRKMESFYTPKITLEEGIYRSLNSRK